MHSSRVSTFVNASPAEVYRLLLDGTGTEVTIEHDGIPDGVSPAGNEEGTRMALANLRQLAERSAP